MVIACQERYQRINPFLRLSVDFSSLVLFLAEIYTTSDALVPANSHPDPLP